MGCTGSLSPSPRVAADRKREGERRRTEPMGKTAALRRRPTRPPARPASARSSLGRPSASASLGQPRPASANWQMCPAWLAGPTGLAFHIAPSPAEARSPRRRRRPRQSRGPASRSRPPSIAYPCLGLG
eukprot:scaffold9651_cov36-Phaeocystis_antarctica.AAC.1